MTHFHPGDRVIIINGETPTDPRIGEVGTVISEGVEMQNTTSEEVAVVHQLDLEVSLHAHLMAALEGWQGICVAYRAEHLKKLDDDGDERELTEWDDCVFKPKELVTV